MKRGDVTEENSHYHSYTTKQAFPYDWQWYQMHVHDTVAMGTTIYAWGESGVTEENSHYHAYTTKQDIRLHS